MSSRREFITLLGGSAAAWPLVASAQQEGERIRRIGVLMGYPEGDPQAQANANALRQGLHSLGWIEGRNIRIDYRWAGADPEKSADPRKRADRHDAGRHSAQH